MKPIKMFGLAALAALLAMAFAGASSAVAGQTALCKTDQNPCETANQVSHVHETSVGKAVLLASETVECDVLFLGEVVAEEDEEGNPIYAGSPLQIFGNFTYANCNGGCTAKEENGPSEIQVLRTGSELATVISGSGKRAGLVHLVCATFEIDCHYVGEGLTGHGLGPLTSSQLNGSVTLSEQTVIEEGNKSLCPEEGKLDITTTPLEKTYIASALPSTVASPVTSLCKADQNPCEATNQVSHVHETSVGKAVLLSSETVECNALFLGDTVEPLGEPLQILGTFTYSNCNGSCTAKEENGPTEIQVLRTGVGVELATVTSGEGTWAGLVNLVCTIFKISCKYVGEGPEGHGLGPLTSSQLNGSVTLSEQTVIEEGEKSLCPNEGKLDITTTPLEKTYIST